MGRSLIFCSLASYAHIYCLSNFWIDLCSRSQLLVWSLGQILMIVRSSATSSSSATPLATTATPRGRGRIPPWATPLSPRSHANGSSPTVPSPTGAGTPPAASPTTWFSPILLVRTSCVYLHIGPDTFTYSILVIFTCLLLRILIIGEIV